MGNIRELQKEMDALQSQIASVLTLSKYEEYDDFSGVDCDIDNPDELLLRKEYRELCYRLSEVNMRLTYLKRDILLEDTLIVRPDGRYGTHNGDFYYTSGSLIEFLYMDEILGTDGYLVKRPLWCISTVEHNGTDYYVVGYNDIDLYGLKVRIRKY